MPYELRGNCVHKVGDSTPMKCYDNHADALAYLRALEANVTDANKSTKAFTGKLDQTEVSYVPLSATKGKACANCRWFLNDGCFIVESYEPEPIMATGYCDRWEATPEPKPDMAEMVTEVVTEAMETMNETMASMPMDMGKALEEPGVIAKIWEGLKTFLLPTKEQSDLMVFKGKDGKHYWLAAFTNNFKDREDEIITEHAHKEFEARLDMKLVPMPELWAWHTEGTRHGKALQVWYQDHNMFAVGAFDETPVAQKAINFYRKHPVKLSHGFVAPAWAFKEGVYDAYNTFEISTLPPHVAANPYTSFEEIKAMTVPETRKAFLEELFGDKAAEVLAKVNAKSDASKELSELVEYKDFSSTLEKKPETENETSKSLKVVFSEVVDQQTELIGFAKSLVQELATIKNSVIPAIKTEKDTEISALKAEIESLKTIVNAPPQRASQSMSTYVAKENAPADALPKQPDDFFADLYQPTPKQPAVPAPNGVN